jgi:hypothetical protein
MHRMNKKRRKTVVGLLLILPILPILVSSSWLRLPPVEALQARRDGAVALGQLAVGVRLL